ncbi:hypothetical protein [Winogradskyella sp.]|uniref:hypothetical protein n=1 Tax=Winogradskyella sp. TaxID=1883156 RepID=UPI0026032169|nr:hypothetical protein [Winogradskyella sp.]
MKIILVKDKIIFVVTLLVLFSLNGQEIKKEDYFFNVMLWREYKNLQQDIWYTHGEFILKEIESNSKLSEKHSPIVYKHIKEKSSTPLDLYGYDDFNVLKKSKKTRTYKLLNNILCQSNYVPLNNEDIEKMRLLEFPKDLIDKLILTNSLRYLLHNNGWYFFNNNYGKNYREINRYLYGVFTKTNFEKINWGFVSSKIDKIRAGKYNRNLKYWPITTYDTNKLKLNSLIQQSSIDSWKDKYVISYHLVNFHFNNMTYPNIDEIVEDKKLLIIFSNLSQTSDKQRELFSKKVGDYIENSNKEKIVDRYCIVASNGFDSWWNYIIENYKLSEINDVFYKKIYSDLVVLKQRTAAFCYLEYSDYKVRVRKMSQIGIGSPKFQPMGAKFFTRINEIPYEITDLNSTKIMELIEIESALSKSMVDIHGVDDSSKTVKEMSSNFFEFITTPYSYIPHNASKSEAERIKKSNDNTRRAYGKFTMNFFKYIGTSYLKNEVVKEYRSVQNYWLNSLYDVYSYNLTRVITNEHSQHARGMKDERIYEEWDKLF